MQKFTLLHFCICSVQAHYKWTRAQLWNKKHSIMDSSVLFAVIYILWCSHQLRSHNETAEYEYLVHFVMLVWKAFRTTSGYDHLSKNNLGFNYCNPNILKHTSSTLGRQGTAAYQMPISRHLWEFIWCHLNAFIQMTPRKLTQWTEQKRVIVQSSNNVNMPGVNTPSELVVVQQQIKDTRQC